MFKIRMSMPVTDDIISFRTGGFDINVDNMKVGQKYRFKFENSRYVFWKDEEDGDLKVKEVE